MRFNTTKFAISCMTGITIADFFSEIIEPVLANILVTKKVIIIVPDKNDSVNDVNPIK